MLEVDNIDFEIPGNVFSILYIHREDCPPCEAVGKKLGVLENKYPDIVFIGIDTNSTPEISGRFMVFSVPAIVLFKDGIEISRWVGTFSMAQIHDLLNQLSTQ